MGHSNNQNSNPQPVTEPQNVRLDLILMDGNLPLLDGFETTRRIRASERGREVPIIFLSGHAQWTAKKKAFAAAALITSSNRLTSTNWTAL